MKPRQWSWRWLLLIALPVVLFPVLLLPLLIGDTKEVSRRITESLSTWSGGNVTFAGPVEVSYFPDVSVRGPLAIANPSRLPLVQSIATKQTKISLDLGQLLLGRLWIDSIRLVRPDISLVLNSASPQSAEAVMTNLLAGAPIGALHVRDGRIRLPSTSGEEEIDNIYAHFHLGEKPAGVTSGFGSFDFRQQEVQFTVEAAPPQAASTFNVALTSNVGHARLRGAASIAEGLEVTGPIDVDIPDARALLGWLGIDLLAGQSLKGFTARGTAHLGNGSLAIDDGTFTLDGNSAIGLLAITAGERPHIEGTLDFQKLNVDPYLPEATSGDETASIVTASAAGSTWFLLDAVDADLRVSARQIIARSLSFGDSGFTITSKAGALAIEVGEIEFCGGAATGRFGIEPTMPRRATLVATLDRISFAPCLSMWGLPVPLSGSGRLEANLGGDGQDVSALMRGLLGTVTLKAENGTLPVDVERLTKTPAPIDTQSWNASRALSFEDLEAECRMADAVVWCRRLEVSGPRGALQGSGEINFVHGTIDWRLSMMGSQDSDPTNPSAATAISIRGPILEPVIRSADRPTLGDGSLPQSSARPVR